jgi:membrane protease YdiL (CAAX protease family)
LLFVFPLLVIYEVGVLSLGGAQPETVRNGADHWLRCGLGALGIRVPWLPPVLLLVAFMAWACLRWGDRPADIVGVLSGMGLESVSYALGLWALSRLVAPVLQRAGIELVLLSVPEGGTDPALRQVITYLGAGIYEETLFRLVLFSALVLALRWLELAPALAVLAAAVASATVFSAAHHVGPFGQAYSNYLFVFRLVAGLYFALLYQLRGFGIAVGAHACYNVTVSVT